MTFQEPLNRPPHTEGTATATRPRTSQSLSLLAQRFLAAGPSNLSDEELAALVLAGGRAGACSLQRAAVILGQLDCRSAQGLPEGVVQLGEQIKLAAAVELGRRWVHRVLRHQRPRPSLADAEEIYNCYGPLLAERPQECAYAVALDSKLRLITDYCVSVGTLNSCAVDVRDVFRAAIRASAYGVAVVHNHPSGDAQPSAEDVLATDQLDYAGRRLGIQLVDHVIIGRGEFYSFKEGRLIVWASGSGDGGAKK